MSTTSIEVGVYQQLQHPASLQRPPNPFPRPDDDSVVGITTLTEKVIEGDKARFRMSRNVAPAVCSVECFVSSDVDDVLAPFTQVESFGIGEMVKDVEIATNFTPGVQGARSATVALRTPIGCTIDPMAVSTPVQVLDLPVNANGFSFARTIIIPPTSVKTTTDITDYMLMVWESSTYLKPVSAGGRIQHAQGWDIQFELADGTILDIDPYFYYDPVVGELVVDVRVPTVSRTANTFVFMYYGKANVLVNPGKATAWRNYLAVLDGFTGVDKTGNSRNVAVTNVTKVPLIGSAGDYGALGKGEASNGAWGNGLTEITVEAICDPEGDYNGTLFNGGPTSAAGASALGIYLGMESVGEVSGLANVAVFKAHVQTTAGANSSRVEGPANSAV